MKNDKKNIIGLDLVDDTPDYSKTKEENRDILIKRHFEAYGDYPSFATDEDKERLKLNNK